MSASCSSDPEEGGALATDSGAQVAPGVQDGASDADVVSDAGSDAALEDVAVPDASPRPVACGGTSCATALVTILGEGFCVLLQDKTVACWGDNANGQLGRGADAGVIASGVAERVLGLVDVVALDHACAIDASGDSWCWGTGPWLQTAAATTKELAPVKLPIPPAKAIRVARSSTNAGTACALVDAGVICWGTNANGQVMPPERDAGPTTAYQPTQQVLPSGSVVRDLAVGDATFAILDDGTVFSWGANPPIGRVSSLYPDPYPRPLALGGFSQIDAANENVCGVAGAAIHCWGWPKTTTTVTQPFDRALPEILVLPESVVFAATSAGESKVTNPLRGCAIGASGSLYCWGNNLSGQVGDGTKDYAITSVKIAGLPEPAAQVRTTPNATCALLTSGRVFCWGADGVGQLGGGRLKWPSAVPREVVLP
ncbi:hypothetical protein AKJ09_04487 [Labilithrix luteola]|uniref:BNR repeat domain protein n=1 Tax=Labilithrix luteola TaxID=1391654 RepID=A0A0K1PWC8_9BACT|nr:hypothetical protein AKJ09_04487 [Labilithrix luteola]